MSETTQHPLIEAPPWHASAIEQARSAWSAGRFPHALLIQGGEGLGKRAFAAWLAAALLCERSASSRLQVCGACKVCAWVKADTHPDLHWVTPEEGKQAISIDQVRSAADRLTRTSAGYKVVLVDPAHQMTVNGANSLLKTLEEPRPRSVLLLITSQPSALPATVRSRCQKLSIVRPSTHSALTWLATHSAKAADPDLLHFAGGAPFKALDYADGRFAALCEQMHTGLQGLLGGRVDIPQLATEWEKEGLIDRLVWLDLWLTSLCREALAGNAERVTFPSSAAHLPRPASPLNITAVYRVVDRVRELKAQLAKTALQRELAIESLLIALLDALTPPSAATQSAARNR